MADLGSTYGFSLETDNTISLFQGFSIEIDINLIVRVVDSQGNDIDNSCVVMIYNAADDTLLSSGNTSKAIFSYSVQEPSALRIVAEHPVEGSVSRSVTHDGETVLTVVLTFVPSFLRFFEANSLRIVITDSPQVDQPNITNQLWKDWNRPYGTNWPYQQLVKRSKQIKIQFISSYEQNFGQWYTAAGVATGGQVTALKVIDLAGQQVYNVYEYIFTFGDFAPGEYYFVASGLDPSEGEYTAVSEPVLIADQHEGTVEIVYSNNDNAFEIDYSTGIEHCLLIKGRFVIPKETGTADIFTDSANNLVKIEDQVQEQILLELYKVVPWIVKKVNLALAHDNLKINGIACVGVEKVEADYHKNSLYASPEVLVSLKQSPFQNLHDNNV